MYGDSKLREFLVSYTKYLDQQGMLNEGQVQNADTLVGDFIHTYPESESEIMNSLYGGLSSYPNVVDLETATSNPEEEQPEPEPEEPYVTSEAKAEELVNVEPPGSVIKNPPDEPNLVNESDMFQPSLVNEEPEPEYEEKTEPESELEQKEEV